MLIDKFTKLVDGEKVFIFSRGVIESGLNSFSVKVFFIRFEIPIGNLREDDVIFAEIVGSERIRAGDHFLVNFLAGADAYDGVLAVWANGLSDVGDAVGRDFWHKEFAAPCVLESMQHHFNAIGERDVKAGHGGVRNRERS